MKQFDLITADKIKSCLKSSVIGEQIYAFWKIASTNTFARERAYEGAPEGTLVIAEEQTQGRGRMNRSWHSPFGKGLWFSIILRPDDASSNAGLYPYLAGVSVAQAIENNLGFSPDLKWPNDLLLSGRKFSGLLSEVEFDNGNIRYIILGIGINVEHKIDDLPDDLLETATSIRIESRIRTDRVELLCEIMHSLEKNYETIKENGFATIMEEWKSRCPKLGKEITIQQANEKITGVFENLQSDGSLLLRADDGHIRKIVAGDLSH